MSGRVPRVTFRPESLSPSRRAIRRSKTERTRPGFRRVRRRPARHPPAPVRGIVPAVRPLPCPAPPADRAAAVRTSGGSPGGRTGVAGDRPGHGHEAVVQGAPATRHPLPGHARPRRTWVRRGHFGSVPAASPQAPRHLTPPRSAPARHPCPRCASPGPHAETSTANSSRSIAMQKPYGDPGADVLPQCLDASADASSCPLVGRLREPPLGKPRPPPGNPPHPDGTSDPGD